jgi:hypothetical protein
MRPVFPWYDSIWLSQYVAARAYFAEHRPQQLSDFVAALEPLRTRPDFSVLELRHLIDANDLQRIRTLVKSLPLEALEMHEMNGFGRFVVHDEPALAAMQESMADLVSERVGERVEPSYSFLSLYTKLGRCPVHMDAPSAKWTLDICIDQSGPWPIHLSQIVPWPEAFAQEDGDWAGRILRDPQHRFRQYVLEQGDALIFSGSSQWHHRESMVDPQKSGFATLLFFHFVPAGMREFASPAEWGRLFGVPQLSAVVDEAGSAASAQLTARIRS